MPLIVVELFPVDLERTTGSAASSKRQLTLAQVRADHVRQFRILRQKYQTGRRVGPKLDVQAVPAQQHRHDFVGRRDPESRNASSNVKIVQAVFEILRLFIVQDGGRRLVEFLKSLNFLADGVWRTEMHHCATFVKNQLNSF